VQRAADIAEGILAGSRNALARMISWAENGDPRFAPALAGIYPAVGRAWRVGVTGPPGAGKSTLVNALVIALRARGQTVGVLAIDPSSPYTGGALLGDRIRMEERTVDPGVFIRSMASRGGRGGLARAAVDACDAMDAFGFDVVLLETVGVGQAEFDVVAAADTVVVVLCPGAGDGVQAMKAGILEVADILVVNKADVLGADRLMLDLSEAAHTRAIHRADDDGDGWEVPVVATTASTGDGVARLLEEIDRHRERRKAGDLDGVRRRKRLAQVRRLIAERLDEELFGPGGYAERAESGLRGSATPYDVAEGILGLILGHRTDAR
jgi:LAO/AO transport system kinase